MNKFIILIILLCYVIITYIVILSIFTTLMDVGYDSPSECEPESGTDAMDEEESTLEKFKEESDEEESDEDDRVVTLGLNTPFPAQEQDDSVHPVPVYKDGCWDFKLCTCPSPCTCNTPHNCLTRYYGSDDFNDIYEYLYGCGPLNGEEFETILGSEYDADAHRDPIEQGVIAEKFALYPALRKVYDNMGKVLQDQEAKHQYNVRTSYLTSHLMDHAMSTFVHAWFMRELCVWVIKTLRHSGLMRRWSNICRP